VLRGREPPGADPHAVVAWEGQVRSLPRPDLACSEVTCRGKSRASLPALAIDTQLIAVASPFDNVNLSVRPYSLSPSGPGLACELSSSASELPHTPLCPWRL